jgi:hypothetical protein
MCFWVPIFFFFVAFSAEAQQPTPQPAPGISDRSEPGKTESTQKNEQGQPKQAETQKQPIIINVLPPQKSDTEAADEKQEREEKRDLDRKTVELTDKLATFTKWLFWATFVLGICTAGLVYFGRKQALDMRASLDIARQSANAAKKSAELAKNTLIATQRAWIRIDQIALSGGLFFNEMGASAAVSFTITNIGNSPAIKISPHARLVVMKISGPFPPEEQRELCDAIRQNESGSGFTLFPNESFPRNIGIAAWSLGINVSREEIETARVASADRKHISMHIVGCIDYTFPADENFHHQTGFILELRMSEGYWINPDEESIPVDRLSLIDFPMGIGRHAD